MYKLFSIFSISSLLQGHALNRRALRTIGTILMLSALLSACGGDSDSSDALTSTGPTTPTFSVSSSNLSIDEDFASPRTVASVSNATAITVSQSNIGVVTVTTSNAQVNISRIANANGRTTLTIRATNGTLTATTQVTVTVNAVNDPPTLTVSTNALTLAEDFGSVIIATTRSDVEGDTLTLTVAESATGVVTVQTTTSGVSVSSIAHKNGRTTLTISLSDGSLSTTAQVVVNVTPVNDPPSLTVSTTALTLAEDFGAVLIATTRTDIDSNTLTLTVAESATGVVTVTVTDAGVSVSNIAQMSGRTTLTITLSDNDLTSMAQVVVDVTGVNDSPVLTVSTNALTLNEDFGSVMIATTRSDVEDDTLTLTVAESTTGVVTVQTSSSGVSVSSIAHKNGRTTLTITLSDSQLSSTAQVVVDVTPVNDAPTFSIPSATLTVAEDFVSTLTIATANDVDGDTLTITVVESSTGIVSVTTSASGVQIVSLRDVNGQTTLTLTVSDSTLSLTTQVVVTVTAINDPPVLSVTTPVFLINEDFSTFTILVNRSDVDSNTLTLTVAESATGVVTVTPTTVGFEVDSISGANGRTTLTITLSDGDQSTTTQVVVDVGPVNDPPVLTVSTNALTLAEDFAMVLIATTRMDIDSTTLTLTVAESATGVVTATVTDTGVQVVNIPNANGRTTLTITLSDGRLSTTTQVVVEVTPVNDPPSLTVTTTALTLAEDFAAVMIGTTRMDIDSTTLTLTVAESTTGVVTVTTSDAGVSVSSIRHANGQTTLTLILTDGGLSTTTQVVVDVTPVNDPPVLTVTTNALTLAEDFGSVIIATTRSDVEGDTLTLTVAESATGVVSVTVTTTGVSVSSIAHRNGRTTLAITLSDSDLSTTTQVVVEVTAVNDPPTLTVSSNSISTFGGFTTITINTTASDIEDSTLSFTVSESTTGVVTVTTSANAILLNTISGATGQTILTVRTADLSGTTVTQTISVNVINSAPVLTVSTSLISVQEDFMTSVTFNITATDIDGDAITLSVSSTTHLVDAALSTLINGQSTITLSAIDHENGTTTLTVQAMAAGQSVSTNVVIVVASVNDTPTLTVSSNSITTAGGFSTIIINTTASDIEDSILSFTVTASTVNVVTVTTSANAITLNAISGATGQTILTVRTADRSGTAVTRTIAVNVINSAPVLTVSTSLISVQEDFMTAVSFSITATDLDGDTITISVSSTTRLVNAALSTLINGQSTITLSSIANTNGTTILTVRATAAGLSVSTNVEVVVVSDNNPPTIMVSSNVVTVGSVPVPLTVTALDLEDSTLSFSVSTGQGIVDTAITTTSLTITRLVTDLSKIMLTLRTTDTDNVSTFTIVTVFPTPMLIVTTGIKTLDFAWSAIPNADYYRLQSAPAGSSYMDFSTTSVVVSPNSTNIRQTTAQALVSLHRYIPRVSGPQFGVNACTSGSCNPSYIGNTVALTNAQLNSMIGRLQASNVEINDEFGASVSLSGDGNTLAVGAAREDSSSTGVNGAQDDNTATDSGAVYLFRRIGGAWSQQAYIKASNTWAGAQFGGSVDLSADGNTLAVGGTYIFRFSTGSNTWSQQAYIQSFGSVDLSADGNTLAVGSNFEDGSSTGVNGVQNTSSTDSGAVYLFRFNKTSNSWTQQAYIKASNTGADDNFGRSFNSKERANGKSISLSSDGNTLAVGANGEDGSSTGVNGAQGDNTATDSGAVYLFRFSTGSSTWFQQAYIKASNTGANDEFGWSVSLNDDGNTLAVGAWGEDGIDNFRDRSGAVYLFRFNKTSNTWSQQAYLNANRGDRQEFGYSVSLSADGNTLAVGASRHQSGSAGIGGVQSGIGGFYEGATFMFEFANGAWAEQAYVRATDPSANAEFGESVSLSADGNTLAVGAGAYFDTSRRYGSGTVYLY